MQKSEKVLLISTIVLVGFFIAVVFHYVLGFYMGLGVPYNSFLFAASSAFCDFKDILPLVADFNPYLVPSDWINYFPLAYILLFPFTLLKNWVLGYLIFVISFLSFFLFMNVKNFYCDNLSRMQNFRNIFLLTFAVYPLLYLLDRGNFDMFLFVVFALFVYAFKSEKYRAAAVFLAVANAMKPFTILFLFLFLFKKKYKEFFLSIGLSSILIIGGFLVLNGDFISQINVFVADLARVSSDYVYGNNNNFGMQFCSSLFPMAKLFLCKWGANPLISTVLLSKIYSVFIIILSLITLVFVKREKLFSRQIALLTCNMLVCPYLIQAYKLIFLFPAIWLFVNEKVKSKFDLAYTVLFAILLIPKQILILRQIHSVTMSPGFSLEIIINPIVMLCICALIIFEQFYKKEAVDEHKENS